MRMGIEQYPRGRQNIRLRAWPHFFKPAIAVAALLVGLVISAALQHALAAALILGIAAGTVLLRVLGDLCAAMTCLVRVFRRYGENVQGTSARVPAPARSPQAALEHAPARQAPMSARSNIASGIPLVNT
jgi:hypothetical protein